MKNQVKRRENIILKLVKLNQIKSEEIDAAELLFDSCCSRYYECRKNTGHYKKNNIKCEWNSIEEFFIDCFDIEEFWDKWKKQTLIFRTMNKRKYRPNINRINNKGNYNKDNIDVLSNRKNVQDARKLSGKAMIFQGGDCIDSFTYSSRDEFLKQLKGKYSKSRLHHLKHDIADFQKLDKEGTYILTQYDGKKLELSNTPYKCVLNNFTTYYINEKGQVFENLVCQKPITINAFNPIIKNI